MFPEVQDSTVDVMIHLTKLISTARALDRETGGSINEEVKEVETSAFQLLSRIHMLSGKLDSQRLSLSETEMQCLQLSADGKTNAEISETLQLSEHSIQTYFSVATKKLSAKNRTHAICEALRLKIIR